MPNALQRALRWWDRNAVRTVLWASGAALAAFLGLAWARFALADATGLDLGIYGQVLWNTAHGNWFGLSVHPHSYLGDHLELGLVALAPFARAFGSIPTLLVTQSLALAAAGPLGYLLARRYVGQGAAAVLALLLLASPFVASAALFEFHFLTLALPVLLALCLAYERRSLKGFYLLCFAVVLVREDMAPVVAGFGVLAALQRRGWRWWLPPIVLGSAWFLGALKVIALASGYDRDKFLTYYAWLGDTPSAVLHTLVLKPLTVLRHVFSLGHLQILLGTLGAVAFIPLAAPLRLIPALPYLAQFFLGGSGIVTLQTHYLVPLLPFLLWSTAAAIAALERGDRGWARRLHNDRALVYTVGVGVCLYSAVFLGPLRTAPGDLLRLVRDPATVVRTELAANLPTAVPLASDFTFLAPAAERVSLYSLHYEYRGRKQLSDEPYRIPADARTAAWDSGSLLAYQTLYTDAVGDGTDRGAERLAAFWTERHQRTVVSLDLVRLTAPSNEAEPLPFTVNPDPPAQPLNAVLGAGIRLEGTDGEAVLGSTSWFDRTVPTLPLAVTLAASEAPEATYNLLLVAHRGKRTVWSRVLPVAYGFYPTVNWSAGERVRTAYTLAAPSDLRGATLTLQLVSTRLTTALDGLRGLTLQVPDTARVGSVVPLGTVR